MSFSARQLKASKSPSHDEASRSSTRPLPSKHPLSHPLLDLQRAIGNQNTQRLLHAQLGDSASVPPVRAVRSRSTQSPQESSTVARADAHFGDDFSQIRVHPKVPAKAQAKPAINAPGDEYEQEANRIAGQVMNMPASAHLPPVQRGMMPQEVKEHTRAKPLLRQADIDDSFEASNNLDRLMGDSKGEGSPLPNEVRAFMEPRFGFDFSQVRVHTDGEAVRMSRDLKAQAFTHHHDIYFGAAKSPARDALTAHELTHVLQQTGGGRLDRTQRRQPLKEEQEKKTERPLAVNKATAAQLQGDLAHVPSVQRVVEVRPPGRGEASAYPRRQELINRLNAQSPAIQYSLDLATERVLGYTVVDAAALTNFDRQMRRFIDLAEVIPLRLITSAGLVVGQPLLVDSFRRAYLDLDDLLASDDLSFRLNLIHMLAERSSVRNYERRIGTPGMVSAGPEFDRAHQAGIDAEVAHLRDVIGDPTIKFIFEDERPNGTLVFGFRSNEGYRVFHVFRRGAEAERGGEVFVQAADGTRMTIAQLRAARAGAGPAPAAPAPAAPQLLQHVLP